MFEYTAPDEPVVAPPASTPWFYSDGFNLRVEGNGDNRGVATGYAIRAIDVIPDRVPSETQRNPPSLYIVDLETWNGSSRGFEASPPPGDRRQERGIEVQFIRECGDRAGSACIDSSSPGDTEDLQFMTCPISAAPAVWTEGGFLRTLYFGDECGQIWKIHRSLDLSGWSVRRLLSTNRTLGDNPERPIRAGQDSRHYRKIFAPVDLVPSTCTGRRAIGVYFGTGNLQTPAPIPSDPPRDTDPQGISRMRGSPDFPVPWNGALRPM